MTTINNDSQVEKKIRDFISQNILFTPGEFSYSDDISFLQEGVIDSLGVMELATFVHSAFGVAVDQQEVTPENFDSVQKLATFIRRKSCQSVINTKSA